MADETNFGDTDERRGFVKGLTCNHKSGPELDEHGTYYLCDKDRRECLIGGRCPGEA